ncbi:MAG: Nramp family divalent metal transporter, partial [Planctomycetes bacterium]|nr:Nramp family divalent metal transporter [Planctomycetota bacterium]
QDKIVYPPLSEDLQGGPRWRSLKYFGAGAIMASVTIGSGETLFASRSGAVFGYALLWCFVGGAIMKGIQVYVGGRHMVLTGQHPMTHWGHMPGPRNWVPLIIGLLSIASFPFWLAGLPLMLGQTINWILGVDVQILGMTPSELKEVVKTLPEGDPQLLVLAQKSAQLLLIQRLWATVAVAIAVTLTCLQSYQLFERAQIAIVGILLAAILAACVASQPDLSAMLAGFVPRLPEFPTWVHQYEDIVKDSEWVFVGVCLGAIGGGTYDYLGYLGCYREKNWGALGLDRNEFTDESVVSGGDLQIDTDPENIRRGRGWLIPVKIDVGVSFLAVVVFTMCFIVLGAVILHPDHAVPDKFALLSKQARFLTDFHPALVYVYQVGIFMAFWGTIYGAYEIYIRTAYECLMPLSRRVRRMPRATFRKWTLVYCATGGLLLIWLGGDDPAAIVKPAAILGGVFACGLWCFAMIWTDRRFLPKALQMGPLLLILMTLSGACLTTIGTLAIWNEYLSQLFGS